MSSGTESDTYMPADEQEEELIHDCTREDVIHATNRFIYKFYIDQKKFIKFLCYSLQRNKNPWSSDSVEDFTKHYKVETEHYRYDKLLDMVKKSYGESGIPYGSLTADRNFPIEVEKELIIELYERELSFESNMKEVTGNENEKESEEAKVDVSLNIPVEQCSVPTLTETETGFTSTPQSQHQGEQCQPKSHRF